MRLSVSVFCLSNFGDFIAYIGRFKRSTVNKLNAHGVFLDVALMCTVLLLKSQVPEDCKIGDSIGLVIHLDSEDRFIAATAKPLAQVSEVACLKVVQLNRVGAFLD